MTLNGCSFVDTVLQRMLNRWGIHTRFRSSCRTKRSSAITASPTPPKQRQLFPRHILPTVIKRIEIIGLLLAGLLSPLPCAADYLVTLKKGTTFFVGDYEVDEHSVSFYHDGGLVGVPRNLVRYISLTDKPAPGVRTEVRTITFGQNSEFSTEEVTENQPAEGTSQDDIYREKAWYIRKDIAKAKMAFIAAQKVDDQQARKQAVAQIMELKKQKSRLYDEVRDANAGKEPHWWKEMQ